jgi:hypothetical protein
MYVAEYGRDADAEPGGELSVGVAAPQVRQGQQRLAAGWQTPPPRPDLPPPGCQAPRQEP